jgi:hypothetical protein
LTQALLALVAVLLATLLLRRTPAASAGQDTGVPAVLRARAVELVDGRGTVRASLRTESDGAVVFRLLDQDGTIRVKLGADADGSGLVLLDDRTEPAIHLLAKRDTATLTLSASGKQKRVLQP